MAKRGRPPAEMTQARIKAAVSDLKKARKLGMVTGDEICTLIGIPVPGAVPDPAGSPVVVRFAPLEDGVEPLESLFYIPDALRELVGVVRHQNELLAELVVSKKGGMQ